MNRIDRLTGMILLLQSHRVITAEQIAAHFEMSMRTVYRDLAALGEAGVPIYAEAGVGYSLMRGYHMPPVMFTEHEAAALFTSGEVTEQIADETLRGALRSALLKVKAVLPKERQDQLNRLKNTVGVWLSSRRKEDDQLAVMPLQQAVIHRRCLAIAYNAGNRGEVTSRVIEPLGMMFYAREWHLIAFCRLRGEFRDFRLDRMQRWEVLTERFDGHEGFSVKEFLANELNEHQVHPTTICFHPSVMDRVRREMHCPDIKEETLPDGRIRMEMLSYSQDWLAGWLMSLGPHAEVIHPPEMRKRLHEMALQVAARHT